MMRKKHRAANLMKLSGVHHIFGMYCCDEYLCAFPLLVNLNLNIYKAAPLLVCATLPPSFCVDISISCRTPHTGMAGRGFSYSRYWMNILATSLYSYSRGAKKYISANLLVWVVFFLLTPIVVLHSLVMGSNIDTAEVAAALSFCSGFSWDIKQVQWWGCRNLRDGLQMP